MCLEILILFASDNFYYNEARNVVCCILIHLLIVRSTCNVPYYIICIIELRNLNECDTISLSHCWKRKLALKAFHLINLNFYEFLWISMNLLTRENIHRRFDDRLIPIMNYLYLRQISQTNVIINSTRLDIIKFGKYGLIVFWFLCTDIYCAFSFPHFMNQF